MSDERRGYDRTFRKALSGPLQLRLGFSTERGDITRFFVQLEYRLDEEWYEVVRYDHDPDAAEEMAHDVTAEGLHIDVYREGEKARSETVSPPMPADVAFTYAEEHLREHLQRFVERFERWHGIRSP